MNIVVNLNKPRGMTSFEAVAAVKRRFKVRKAGHAGTLDPLATGVLVVCLNEATKIAGVLSHFEKEYVFTARLGEATDTYDAEGSVIRRVEDVSVTTDEIRACWNGSPARSSRSRRCTRQSRGRAGPSTSWRARG